MTCCDMDADCRDVKKYRQGLSGKYPAMSQEKQRHFRAFGLCSVVGTALLKCSKCHHEGVFGYVKEGLLQSSQVTQLWGLTARGTKQVIRSLELSVPPPLTFREGRGAGGSISCQ